MTDDSAPRVLVVEDEPGIRRLLVRFLSARGCAVEVAADGTEGLSLLGAHRFDVVVCDITMPRLDGVRLWDAVRKQAPAGAAPAFVFASALPLPPEVEQGRTVRYLQKPFALAEVWQEIQAVLELREG